MKKRMLSVLLCLCMVCPLLPVTALAAGNGGDQVQNGISLRYDGDSVLTVDMPSSAGKYTYGTASGNTATQSVSNTDTLPDSDWNWAVQKHVPDANGSGTSYTDKQSITMSESVTLYAQWTENPPPEPTPSAAKKPCCLSE